MGILSGLFTEKRERKGYGEFDDYWYMPFRGKVKSGAEVDEFSSLNYSAVWLAISFIAQTIGSLPLHIYRDLDGEGKSKAKNHPLYPIVHKAPNRFMPAMTFWETIIAHAVSWGNGYAEKVKGKDNRIKELWPIPPNRCEPVRRGGSLEYDVNVGSKKITLSRDQVLHIPGLGYDGWIGYSVLTMARESIGMGLAAEEYGARFFGHGAQPGMIVTHPGRLGPETQQKLQSSMASKYEGLGHAHRMMLLDEGMKAERLGFSQKDCQFLETRVYQIEEIARWFNLPPHVLKNLDKATYSNIESQALELVKYSLRPWMVRIEQHCDLQLLGRTTKPTHYHKFNAEGLLKGDYAARQEYYRGMWNIGAMSINDIREKEDMNPIPDGDTYFVPLNAVPIDLAKQGMDPSLPPKEEPPANQNSGQNSRRIENRAAAEHRSITERKRLEARYKPLFREATQRIANKEAIAVKRQVEKLMRNRAKDDFDKWLDEFYGNLDQDIKKAFRAVMDSYAESIHEAAGQEVGLDDVSMTPEMRQFVDEYLQGFSYRYINSSLGQLRQLLQEDSPEEAITQRVEEWTERQPDKTAHNETVRLGGAIATALYFSQGYRAKWRTIGESCPFCRQLNGKVISRDQTFANEGDEIEAEVEGKKERLPITNNLHHAPAHQGCDCVIVAG